MSDDIMTVKEMAEFLKLTERTIYRLAAENQFPAFKVGGSWRFRRVDVEDWIEAKKAKAKEKGDSGDH
jgi:excisionase family DNA binding protein